MPELKICGVNDAEFAREAVRLGADYIGMIFAPDSPRRVDVETACEIARHAGGAKLAGVFTTSGAGEIASIAQRAALDVVQLHGKYGACDVKALKAHAFEVWRLDDGEGSLGEDATIVDGRDGEKCGGTGRVADWTRIKQLKAEKRKVVLAGGIGCDNIEAAVATGADIVDVNSSLESQPGVKSAGKLVRFMTAFNAAKQNMNHTGRQTHGKLSK